VLKEIAAVKQDSRDTKRWFRDEYFDLYLWQTAAGEIVSLQLCYNRIHNEHILRWSAQEACLHARVDAPQDKPGRAMSAMLVANGVFPAKLVREDFLKAALEIPDEVRDFVLSCMAGCSS
jgi:hypothetical protein